MEEWALGYFGWRGKKKKNTGSYSFLSQKKWEVRVPAIEYCATTPSQICPSLSALYTFLEEEGPCQFFPWVLGTSCLLEAVPTNCIMINGGLNIVRACRCGTSDSVVTNFDSTPKQAEQHDNNQGLSVFMPTPQPPPHPKLSGWMELQVYLFLLG